MIAGEAYHTDIEDILKCIRRCAERNEVFVLTSHGIHPAAKDIHMKTEWLERILATASECGVQCLGFDELKWNGWGQTPRNAHFTGFSAISTF